MQKPDCVLIDDDTLVHMTWNMVARERHKVFCAFGQAKDFFEVAADFDKDTPIYVDSDLGSGVRGESVSKKLTEMGFTTVYLATGHDAGSFSPMPWLKGVVGKEPPWL